VYKKVLAPNPHNSNLQGQTARPRGGAQSDDTAWHTFLLMLSLLDSRAADHHRFMGSQREMYPPLQRSKTIQTRERVRFGSCEQREAHLVVVVVVTHSTRNVLK
jgi:hypothetical protein